MTRRILIDTDPGKDDAVALFLALASPELDLEAVLTVHGNVPLQLTTRNARALLAFAGASVPVYAGCPRPMLRPPVHAQHVHGDGGLGPLGLPEPPPAPATAAIPFLIASVLSAPPQSITLCLLGPATNLAVALIQAPEIAARLEGVVMMGGAIAEPGNVTPAAEFNIYADPEAARVVVESGACLTLVPLDLTHRMRLTPRRLERLRTLTTPQAQAVVRLFEADECPPLHDPCVIAHLIDPTLFQGRPTHLQVETVGAITTGLTLADDRAPPNAVVLEDGDAERFFDLLARRLAGAV